MPGYDKTGPLGQGPRTGRGLGPCGGGLRRGRGLMGRFGYGFRRSVSRQNQLVDLDDEEAMLKEELAAVREEKAAQKEQKKQA